MFCPECGTKAEDSAVFCMNCGYKLRDVAVKPASTVSKAEEIKKSADIALEAPGIRTSGKDKVTETVPMHPIIASVKYSVSSIPVFVLTFVYTVLSFYLTVSAARFEFLMHDILYYVNMLTYDAFSDLTNDISTVSSVVVWIVLSQTYLMCAGLWMTSVCGIRPNRPMNTAGLKMINAINKITFAEVILVDSAITIGLIAALGEVSNNEYLKSLENTLSLALFIFIVFFVLVIVYFAKLIGTVNNAIMSVVEKRVCGDTSMYVIVMSFASSIILFLFLNSQSMNFSNGSGFIMFLVAVTILFTGISFIRYKTVMDDAIKEAAKRSLFS